MTILKSNIKGYSIIELVVSMMLVAIITVPLTIFFGSTIRSFFSGKPPLIVEQVLYDAVNEISDNLREGRGVYTNSNNTTVRFKNKLGQDATILLNTSNYLIERVEGGKTTYIPYYNTVISPQVIFNNSVFGYLTDNNVRWNGTGNITSVELNLTGTYNTPSTIDFYSLILRNIVTLRIK